MGCRCGICSNVPADLDDGVAAKCFGRAGLAAQRSWLEAPEQGQTQFSVSFSALRPAWWCLAGRRALLHSGFHPPRQSAIDEELVRATAGFDTKALQSMTGEGQSMCGGAQTRDRHRANFADHLLLGVCMSRPSSAIYDYIVMELAPTEHGPVEATMTNVCEPPASLVGKNLYALDSLTPTPPTGRVEVNQRKLHVPQQRQL